MLPQTLRSMARHMPVCEATTGRLGDAEMTDRDQSRRTPAWARFQQWRQGNLIIHWRLPGLDMTEQKGWMGRHCFCIDVDEATESGIHVRERTTEWMTPEHRLRAGKRQRYWPDKDRTLCGINLLCSFSAMWDVNGCISPVMQLVHSDALIQQCNILYFPVHSGSLAFIPPNAFQTVFDCSGNEWNMKN